MAGGSRWDSWNNAKFNSNSRAPERHSPLSAALTLTVGASSWCGLSWELMGLRMGIWALYDCALTDGSHGGHVVHCTNSNSNSNSNSNFPDGAAPTPLSTHPTLSLCFNHTVTGAGGLENGCMGSMRLCLGRRFTLGLVARCANSIRFRALTPLSAIQPSELVLKASVGCHGS